MKTNLKLAFALATSVAAAIPAHAVPITGPMGSGTLTATSATGATTSPFPLAFFGSSSANGLVSTAPVFFNGGVITFSPNGSTPQAGVYAGNVNNISTSPFSGTSLPGGSQNEYIVAQPNDPVTLSYNTARTTFNLLWGTVDTYNSLDLRFFNGTTLVGDLLVSGSSVLALDGGGNGSAFVSITDDVAFNTIVLSSTSNAFEFVPSVNVPEPVSMALLGTGLLGMGLVIRRRRNNAL